MTTNKKTALPRVQPLKGQESNTHEKELNVSTVPTTPAPINDLYTPLSGANSLAPRFAPGWSAPAPLWATHAHVSDPTYGNGDERDVDFASEAPAPWHAHVERFDSQEGDDGIEVGQPTIRVFGAPDEKGAGDDITSPEQARAMAASLLRAAALLERLQAPETPAEETGGRSVLGSEQLTPCPSWCRTTARGHMHTMDELDAGVVMTTHVGRQVETESGVAAWVERADARLWDGVLLEGLVHVGIDVNRETVLEPATAVEFGSALVSLAYEAEHLRDEAAAGTEVAA